MPAFRLSEQDERRYQRDGFLLVRGLLPDEEVRRIGSWIAEVAALAGHAPELHCYGEEGVPGALRQIENFCPVHPKLHALAVSDPLLGAASQLLGEEALLFKDKINFKPPGGAGYEAHRDGRFWWKDPEGRPMRGWDVYADDFLSALIAVDPSDAANGCLELVAGKHRRQDLPPEYGPLEEAEAAAMEFQPCPAAPGDVIYFNALVPHRSGSNRSDRPRRALYLTYHPRRAGDQRARYFRDKQLSLKQNQSRNR